MLSNNVVANATTACYVLRIASRHVTRNTISPFAYKTCDLAQELCTAMIIPTMPKIKHIASTISTSAGIRITMMARPLLS